MRLPRKHSLLCLLIPLALLFTGISVCYANAPPPPTIAVIVSHAPENLELSIGAEKAQRTDNMLESIYTFYLDSVGTNSYTLKVTEGDDSFEIALPQLQKYNNVFTLDLDGRSLTPGVSSWRPYGFASVTLVLTILIEGVIFFIFGYRKRTSWLVFLIANTLTQGFLYFWLNVTNYPVVSSYFAPVFLSLIFGEFWVFVIEIAAFLIFVRERRRLVTLAYVILANLASAIAGYYLIRAFL